MFKCWNAFIHPSVQNYESSTSCPTGQVKFPHSFRMHGHTYSHVDTKSFWNEPFPLYLCSHRGVPSTSTISTESKIFPKSFPRNDNFFSRSRTKLPREWTDSYSLVNQRVLYAALTESQWDSALVEAHRVLAPGGWVQSIEGSEIPPHTGPYSERIGKILAKLHAHKGLVIDVAKRLLTC